MWVFFFCKAHGDANSDLNFRNIPYTLDVKEIPPTFLSHKTSSVGSMGWPLSYCGEQLETSLVIDSSYNVKHLGSTAPSEN